MIVQTEAIGRIVVGTDGSQRANKAVEWAADRAVARKLPLLVIYIIPEQPTVAITMIPQAAQLEREARDQAKQKVNAVVEAVKSKHPGLNVIGVSVEGNPAYVLSEWSRDAELVVIGARGQGGAPMSVRLLGGVSDAVAAHGHGPIAVVSDDAVDHPGGPVVVGVDDSPEARAALRLAFEAAEVRGVPVVAVHAYDYGPREAPWVSDPQSAVATQLKEQLAGKVEEVLAEVKEAHPHVPIEIQIVGSRPQDALVEASKQAGLVVVGSRGRGGFSGLLLGSTSKHVLREAYCPVIVTRGKDEGTDEASARWL